MPTEKTKFQVIKAETVKQYKALLEAIEAGDVEGFENKLLACIVEEDNFIYFNGKKTSAYVEVIDSFNEAEGTHMGQKSYKFSLPNGDEFTLENAFIPELTIERDKYDYPTIKINNLKLHDQDSETDLYSNGLMSAFDKYRLNVLWQMTGGEISEQNYFVHDYHDYDLQVASIEQGVDDYDLLDYTNLVKKDIPVFYKEDERGGGSWGYWVLDEKDAENNPDEYFVLAGKLRKVIDSDIPGRIDSHNIEQAWIEVPEEKRMMVSIESEMIDFTDPVYKPGVPLDTRTTRAHGALPEGTSAGDLVNNEKTISHILDSILFDKIHIEKVQEFGNVRLIAIRNFDPETMLTPGSAYPPSSNMDIEYDKEKWVLKYSDGSEIGKEFVLDYNDVYDIEKEFWMYDGNHAAHRTHYHIHEDPKDLVYVNYPLDSALYQEHQDAVIIEDDRCVFYGVLHLKPKDELFITGPDGVNYPIDPELVPERWIYTVNAWYLGTFYNNNPYWRPVPEPGTVLTEGEFEDKYPASLLQMNATEEECPMGLRHYFREQDFYYAVSSVYTNTALADVSVESLYAGKNEEPGKFEEINGKLTDSKINLAIDKKFYVKFPSGTSDDDKFIVAIPNPYRIIDVKSAHDTYDEKYIVPCDWELVSEDFLVPNFGETEKDAPVLYKEYYIGQNAKKTTGILTVEIKVTDEPED